MTRIANASESVRTLDPLIVEVFDKLPRVRSLREFPPPPLDMCLNPGFKNRKQWLALLNAAFDVVYGPDT